VFQRRPVGLWTTRSTEFPTSPTGLHYYYEFRQSSSTQNDEGPSGGIATIPPQTAAPIPVVTPATIPENIALWGDSLSGGAYRDNVALQLPGREIYMGGVGGQTSTQIAARQGGVVTLLSVVNDTIPATGAVAVTYRSVSPMTSQGGGPFSGTLGGVPGSIARATDDSYSFTRTTSGAITQITPSTSFFIDTLGRDSWISVFWMGRNNFSDSVQVKSDIASAIAFLKESPKKFVVLSILNSTYEPKGSSGYQVLIGVNADLAALYPSNYIDIRSYLVSQYDPTSAQDISDFQNDLVPTSLRGTDPLHINAAGDLLVAKKIAEFFAAKGW